MTTVERRVFGGLVLLSALIVSRGSPAMSGDAPYFLAVSHSIARDFDLDLRNQFQPGGTYLFQADVSPSFARAGSDGRLYPSQGLGFSAAMVPVYVAAEAIAGVLPESLLTRLRWNRQRCARDLISIAIAILAAWVAVLALRLCRRLCGLERGQSWTVALAFATPPLVFASILAMTEVPAAFLCVWFILEQTRPNRRPYMAALPLALLPWLHMRYLLVTLAGLLWILRARDRQAASGAEASSTWAPALPLVSVSLLGTITWWMFGSIIPPGLPERIPLSVWRWLTGLPSVLIDWDAGLLWVAPFWIAAIAGAGRLRGVDAGYVRFAGTAAVGLAVMADVFDNGIDSRVPGLLLAPALPMFVPMAAEGLRRAATRWRRSLAAAAVVWALIFSVLVVNEPRRLLADPGAGIGRLPQRAIAWVRGLNSPQVRLARLGFVVDRDAFLGSIRGGHVNAVELFLDAGFPPEDGLLSAVQSGQEGSLSLLVSRGAARTAEAARALAWAREFERDRLANVLTAAGVTLDTPDSSREAAGETALMTAIRQRRPKERALLLRLGANVNAASPIGETALAIAVVSADAAAVRDLVAAGADVNAADRDGWTPLMVAARLGRADEARALIEAGAGVNTKSRMGWTPLMWAAYGGSLEIVSALIAAGADANAASAAGQTPLIRAAGQGHLAIVHALLAAGAKVEAEVNGRTARDWAERNGHADMASLLARTARTP